jgi:hypothetical protein
LLARVVPEPRTTIFSAITAAYGPETQEFGLDRKLLLLYKLPHVNEAISIMTPSYRRLQQYAIGISVISVLYNGAEGAVSIGLGSKSSSRSLVFFGVQSGVEVISAGIVVWRFNKIARPGEEKDALLGSRELRYINCCT